ncbi:uncharacterized protein LOC143343867 [Colletes latitarsis]|uniref:uncharacterized protein LOC143343867 n=1 Tax=Colletes latitarsis TaxID=2605962 RepID=UPI004036B7E9
MNKIMETEYQNNSKPSTSTTSDYILPSKSGNNFTQMNQISKLFKEIKIQNNIEYNEEKDEQFAGQIDNIIQELNVVLVKPFSSDSLLYFGTQLFLKYGTKYTLLGYIDDIFGSIGKPMYSVTIECNPEDISIVNTQVYYFPNNPSTSYMYVKQMIDEASKKEKYSTIIKHL